MNWLPIVNIESSCFDRWWINDNIIRFNGQESSTAWLNKIEKMEQRIVGLTMKIRQIIMEWWKSWPIKMTMLAPDMIINENGAYVYIWRQWLSSDQAIGLYQTLKEHMPWEQKSFNMYNRIVQEPRLTLALGDPGLHHDYTGIKSASQIRSSALAELFTRPVLNWHDPTNQAVPGVVAIQQLARAISPYAGDGVFNAALLNYYRDDKDHISYHSDKETSKRQSTVVGLSLGGSRQFYLKRKMAPFEVIKTIVHNGDLMVMAGSCQQHWTHSVPKLVGAPARISITYRLLD